MSEIERLAEIAREAWLAAPRRAIDLPEMWVFQLRAILTAMKKLGDDDLHLPMFNAPRRAGVMVGDYPMAAHEAQEAWNEILDHILNEEAT